jgi:hypothetical protein
MVVSAKFAALAESRWYEYVIRFLLGGTITVLTGVIAKYFGPVAGGLFLAFPAIFPASATLVEKHQREKKEAAGLPGARRGREAAALEALGSALGSLGLVAFGAVVWWLAPTSPALALPLALAAWLVVSVSLWLLATICAHRVKARPPEIRHDCGGVGRLAFVATHNGADILQ